MRNNQVSRSLKNRPRACSSSFSDSGGRPFGSDTCEAPLCLGAHCDDIEIGAGGTILNLAKANPQIEVKWVVFGGEIAENGSKKREPLG
jgi:hypothetical protein